MRAGSTNLLIVKQEINSRKLILRCLAPSDIRHCGIFNWGRAFCVDREVGFSGLCFRVCHYLRDNRWHIPYTKSQALDARRATITNVNFMT
jgi:hypothetical protein